MTAQAALQSGFGEFLGAENYDAVRGAGFTIVRIDLQECDQVKTSALAQEAIDAGLQPLCIIRRVDQMRALPDGALVELGNEPNDPTFGWTRASYRVEAAKCVAEALVSRQRLYLGAVNNLHHDGFAFLRDLPWQTYPPEICCSIHRYPEARGLPTAPHHGSRSRADEVNTLRQIVGARPLACSEIGYIAHEWTEEQVAQNMTWERRFFSEEGFDFVVLYKLNDPPEGTQYGVRRFGTVADWKPVVSAFTGA